jgi:hypothetical protein
MEKHERIRIEIDPRIGELLEDRGIREEDIRQVISYAKETMNASSHSITGHQLAYYRPSRVTYWVEYEQKGDIHRIHKAYLHRMLILEGFNMPAKLKQRTDWLCLKCGVHLELATVKLTYLDETFTADIPACPSCQRVFVSEENAIEKMALAEKMLEDK